MSATWTTMIFRRHKRKIIEAQTVDMCVCVCDEIKVNWHNKTNKLGVRDATIAD